MPCAAALANALRRTSRVSSSCIAGKSLGAAAIVGVVGADAGVGEVEHGERRPAIAAGAGTVDQLGLTPMIFCSSSLPA